MDDQTSTRRRKIIGWVLAASLGANLLFIGAFAGAAYRFAGGPGAQSRDGAGMRNYAAPYVRALPHDTRKSIFRALRESGQGVAPMTKNARRALYRDMVSALRAIPFDAKTVGAVLRRQQDAALGVQSAAQAAWLAEVTKMTPAARARYADKLDSILKSRQGHRERGKRRDN